MYEHRVLDLIEVSPEGDGEIRRSKMEESVIGNFNVGARVARAIKAKPLSDFGKIEACAVIQSTAVAIADDLSGVAVTRPPKRRVIKHSQTRLALARGRGVVDGPNFCSIERAVEEFDLIQKAYEPSGPAEVWVICSPKYPASVGIQRCGDCIGSGS